MWLNIATWILMVGIGFTIYWAIKDRQHKFSHSTFGRIAIGLFILSLGVGMLDPSTDDDSSDNSSKSTQQTQPKKTSHRSSKSKDFPGAKLRLTFLPLCRNVKHYGNLSIQQAKDNNETANDSLAAMTKNGSKAYSAYNSLSKYTGDNKNVGVKTYDAISTYTNAVNDYVTQIQLKKTNQSKCAAKVQEASNKLSYATSDLKKVPIN